MMNRKDYYYNVYLKGNRFTTMKKQMLEEHPACEMCGGKSILLHHNNYINLGKETYGVDVIALCKECHESIHGIRSTEMAERDNNVPQWLRDFKLKAPVDGGIYLLEIIESYFEEDNRIQGEEQLRVVFAVADCPGFKITSWFHNNETGNGMLRHLVSAFDLADERGRIDFNDLVGKRGYATIEINNNGYYSVRRYEPRG